MISLIRFLIFGILSSLLSLQFSITQAMASQNPSFKPENLGQIDLFQVAQVNQEAPEKEDAGGELENEGEEPDKAKIAEEAASNSKEVADIKAPEVQFDLSKLPFPARKMRELIYEAAKSGDIEKLRPYIGYGDDLTMLSLGGYDEDPIEFLKSISGDENGHELLAIITEILDAGFVLMDEGTDREMYVWPYFYAHPLQNLTPEQKVQLFRLITFGDFQDMETFGAYIFYRLGISPEGRWRFFVAGD